MAFVQPQLRQVAQYIRGSLGSQTTSYVIPIFSSPNEDKGVRYTSLTATSFNVIRKHRIVSVCVWRFIPWWG